MCDSVGTRTTRLDQCFTTLEHLGWLIITPLSIALSFLVSFSATASAGAGDVSVCDSPLLIRGVMYLCVCESVYYKQEPLRRPSRVVQGVHVRTRDGLASSGSKGHTPQNTLSLSGPTPDWPARTDFNYARAQAEADFLRAGACVCARDTGSAREVQRHDKTSSCRPHKGQRAQLPPPAHRAACSAAPLPHRMGRRGAPSRPKGRASGARQHRGACAARR